MADRQWRSKRFRSSAAALVALGALAAPAVAQAALPTVSTGQANQVSYSSAVLTGSVNPNGANTSYYFQFGPTRAYGGQSAIADAGGGTHAVKVSLAIGGLQPLTLYHFRLVAVNGSGASLGKDHTLLTTKVPLSLQILFGSFPIAQTREPFSAVRFIALPSSGKGCIPRVSFTSSTPRSTPFPRSSRTTPYFFRHSSRDAR